MIDEITLLLLEAAREAIIPRYRRLGEEDVIEKSPGELVTAADREAERIIASALLDRFPGSRVVGEEACAAAPELLDDVGSGQVWLLDPLDGTANFVAGQPPFSVMLALLDRGECVASWMIDPLTSEACVAERGSGAFRDGRRVRTSQAVPAIASLRGAVLSHFMPADVRNRVLARLAPVERLSKLMCSGAGYPAIAAGERHVSLFWRTLPWDHVPGALFLEEAGGRVCRLDGGPYRAEDEADGLIVAANAGIAEEIVERLGS